ncbi:hypothetical protein M8C21_013753 [Ambrosia artemisiifolia]|uniref:Vacuolar protein sorting-associated protein 55-like protein n=1 Tax=Ambrosia artemisiifolia TaxID=4212 RepID=A0AAD5CS83_AMBAR|nr:hypothetical protein M8C21_013753 [Ambrosia artemisiifolia]
MLSALMYILVPMPCMFFGDGSTESLINRDDDGCRFCLGGLEQLPFHSIRLVPGLLRQSPRVGGGWINAAKFLTGASLVGSLAIPIILRHADFISTGAMLIEFLSFFIFLGTVMCYYRVNSEDEWSTKESSLGMFFTL